MAAATPSPTPHPNAADTPPGLPLIISARDFIAADPAPPPDIVPGIFHQLGKFTLGGGSKTHKTWVLADLGLSVAAGVPWLRFPTVQGRVLYINFEIPDGFFKQRLQALIAAKGMAGIPDTLDLWNLRGHATGYESLIPLIYERIKESLYTLIITDPIYKMYGANTKENDAGDVAELLNAIDKLAMKTKAGAAFGAHFSKGNQTLREAIDRVSGSGVFGRDPDSILNMTPHQETGCSTVDIILRNYPPSPQFVVRWEFPLMRLVELDPKLLRKAGGRPVVYPPERLLEFLRKHGPFDNSADFLKRAKAKIGISKGRFYDLLPALEDLPSVKCEGESWAFSSTGSPILDSLA